MAQRAFPFDTGAGAAVLESDWQKLSRAFLGTGVLTGRLNQLAVSADGSALSVSVASGQAQVEGFFYENDAALALTIATANATNPRIDTVVVRLDRTANTTVLAVVTGTAAASPVAPTLSLADALYEMALANVLVPAAAGVIAAANVTDRRVLVRNANENSQGGARAFVSAAQSIANAVAVVVALDGETEDTNAFHDTATNNSRMTIPTGRAGRYLIAGAVGYAAHATGYRQARLHVNGAVRALAAVPTVGVAGVPTRVPISDVARLVAGDFVELAGVQDSGGALALEATFTFLTISYLGA